LGSLEVAAFVDYKPQEGSALFGAGIPSGESVFL
jgi:hypothetical protein